MSILVSCESSELSLRTPKQLVVCNVTGFSRACVAVSVYFFFDD